MPNFPANLLQIYHARSFDPNTNLAAPYQSGMTGLMFDQKKTGPQDSLAVLFSDKFAGKMTYLDEWRDTIGLSALNLELRPGKPHPGAVRRIARARSRTRSKNGWVRQILGNSYTELTWSAAGPSWPSAGPATSP